jgi:hypothetical protein
VGFVYLRIGARAFFKCGRRAAAAISMANWIVRPQLLVGMAVIGKALQPGIGGV